jgi:hypothetical protein
VVDYVKHWSQRTELAKTRLVGWLGVGTSKFYQWQERYGQANEHNGQVPRDFWLGEWEKRAILDFHDRHPLEGYRRLAFMMLDEDVVAVSPSSVYRVHKAAARLDRRRFAPSKKGTGFVQPLAAHEHWHVDVSYWHVLLPDQHPGRIQPLPRPLGDPRAEDRGRRRNDRAAGLGEASRRKAADHQR